MSGDEPQLGGQVQESNTGQEPELSGARPRCEVCGMPYSKRQLIPANRVMPYFWIRRCDCPPNQALTIPEQYRDRVDRWLARINPRLNE